MKALSCLLVASLSFFFAVPALAQSAPPPPPSSAPPPPRQDLPLPPASGAAPDGQWINTSQYGWVWMPYGSDYVAPSARGAAPYGYVYYPRFGWTWVTAPWIFGWGPVPHFPHGATHFHWFHAGLFGQHDGGYASGHHFGRPAYHGNLHHGGHRTGGHQGHGSGHHGGGAHHR